MKHPHNSLPMFVCRPGAVFSNTALVLFMLFGNALGGVAQDDYPFKASSPDTVDAWNFFCKECTSWVAWRVNGQTQAPLLFHNRMPAPSPNSGYPERWSNARYWEDHAIALGYRVDAQPEVGAIAQWRSNEQVGDSQLAGPEGHVAFVEQVNADGSVMVSEYNFGVAPNDHKFSSRVIHAPRYIHFKKFNVGDAVQATGTVNVRLSPGGASAVSARVQGDTGTIQDGPLGEFYPDNSAFYRWYRVQWKNGDNGWSIESPLSKIVAPVDTTPPTVTITQPTTGSTYSTAQSTVSLSGQSQDNVGVAFVAWSGDRGQQGGSASGTTTWSIADIPLIEGANVITVSAFDAAGNKGTATLTVTYTPPPPPPTKAISLTGDLSFGTVSVGNSASRTFTIHSDGTAALTVTAINYPSGFSGSWSGTIAAGGSQNVPVVFSPTAPGTYGGSVTVSSDGTGVYTLAVSGTGSPGPTPTVYTFSTLAGLAGAVGSIDASGNASRFGRPWGIAVDGHGNVYVADSLNASIRVIGADGAVRTLAGTAGNDGYLDGQGSAARFLNPIGVAVDSAGTVYVADLGNSVIRAISPTGLVRTLAGQAGSSGSADGTGTAAQFYAPTGVAVDQQGTVYVADASNQLIRKITPSGVVTTIAGSARSSGSADGPGGAARFHNPSGIAVSSAGTIYVADTFNDTIRVITPDGSVTTLAGLAGTSGSADGSGSNARFADPYSVAVDSAGTVYVADSANDTIRMISASGVVTTIAGQVKVVGSVDGIGSVAQFNDPNGIAIDGSGNLFIADTGNLVVRTSAPVIGPITLKATRQGNQVALTWNDSKGALESAAAISGPWHPVAGASGKSWSEIMLGSQQFYRVRR